MYLPQIRWIGRSGTGRGWIVDVQGYLRGTRFVVDYDADFES